MVDVNRILMAIFLIYETPAAIESFMLDALENLMLRYVLHQIRIPLLVARKRFLIFRWMIFAVR